MAPLIHIYMAGFTFPGRGIVCVLSAPGPGSVSSHYVFRSTLGTGRAVTSWVLGILGGMECQHTIQSFGTHLCGKNIPFDFPYSIRPVAVVQGSFSPFVAVLRVERYSMQIQLLWKMSIKNRNWNVNNLMLFLEPPFVGILAQKSIIIR